MNPEPRDYQTLFRALHHPRELAACDLTQWDRLLPLARTTGLLGRLASGVAAAGLASAIPEAVRWHLVAAGRQAEHNRHSVGWELERLGRTLAPCDFPLVLLKGAAYVAADLPPAEGRIASDVDLLVPADRLAEVESCLAAAGWQAKELPPRDAAYFRRWLHEIPPLVHPYRKTELDVHHNLLPGTDPLQIDPASLLSAARPAPAAPWRVLAPADMILHAAAHLFRNGDFTHGLRDLVDIHLLVRHFGADPDFWPTLLERARQLRLCRPAWMALHFAERFLQASCSEESTRPASLVPDRHRTEFARWRPFGPLRRLADRVVPQALLPARLDRYDARRYRALWLMAHYPPPRLRTMLEPVFWTKRVRVGR